MIGCISNSGMVHSLIKRGAFKKEDALEFVEEAFRKANDIYHGPVVIIIDNAPAHSTGCPAKGQEIC